MIKAKTPLVNKPESQEKVKFFIAENDIIPIRPVTHEMITQLTEIKDEVIINEEKVQTLVKQHKTTNQFNKFFIRIGVYVDRLEKFLKDLKRGYIKLIVQQKVLLESEKSDQLLRTYRAKREVNKILDEEKKYKKKSVTLDASNTELLGALAAALGVSAVESAAGMFGDTQVYSDVVSQGEFTVDRSGEQTQRIPAWIPFPKGTSGLVFTSGFGYQNWRGREHGGIDIAGAVGTPIITPITGVVTSAGDEGDGYGYKVVVKSGQVEMLFGHLYRIPPVTSGQQIQAGTVIGGIGSTGRSTGPHLHWTIYVNGGKVDPALWTQSNKPSVGTSGARVDSKTRTLDQESEGAFMTTKRIMVGEADPEFIIPMSKMPLFIKAMIEEKIKSMNPYYQVSSSIDNFIEPLFGSSQTKFASGAITGGSPEFWKIVALASREDTLHPQGQADVAQSLYNRSVNGSYPGGKNISSIITADGQYQPTFDNPGVWKSIKDRKSAISAAGKGAGLIDMAAKSITNPLLQREAARFVGGRTDFMGESQKPYMKAGDITRGKDYNFHGWFYDARLPKAAPIASSVKSMSKPTTVPPKPKVKDKNIFEKFMLWINPPKSERASLNQIDGSQQMEIARTIQNEMDYTNDMIDITYLYKPIVKVPVDLA
jgi:murein DD-endopeptidase MepM/ murein hydrolase activator NlpD